MIEFAELCAKTNFSLLEGASRPEEMIESAQKLGIYAIAVADSRGLYGTVRAHVAAKKIAQKYIVAVELPVSLDRTKKTKPLAKVVILVENKAGYENLCRLVTRAHVDLPREEALLDIGDLASRREGLFVVVLVPSESEIKKGEL